MQESLPGDIAELWIQEVMLGPNFLPSLQGLLDLKSWLQESVLLRESEVELDTGEVGVVANPEELEPLGIIKVVVLEVVVALDIFLVVLHLFLGIDIRECLHLVPPVFTCHHHHGIGLDVMDQLLSSLAQQSRHVRSAN